MMEYTVNPKLWVEKSKDLEQYLGKPIHEIEREYYRILDRERAVEDRLYVSQDTSVVSDFYRTTSRYLYELLHWESSFDKQDAFALLCAFLRGNTVSKALDFGGGIGGFVLYANCHGCSCDYLDIKGQTFDFAQWRIKKYYPSIAMFNALDGYPANQYGAVVAYDVLEHVADIASTVQTIGSLLLPGGYFLVKPTFSGGGIHLQVNERYNDIIAFNAMLAANQFSYVGRLKPSSLSILAGYAGLRLNAGYQISPKVKYGGNFLVYRKCL
jgi:2-polyprenyl-3-methyl-5-hydroxy-6-metoxy-1,4-benzoquinol methylase